jgi:hypothetical protein
LAQELDQAGLKREPDQVGAALASGLGADLVEPVADGADADVQFPGYLGVGPAPGDEGDQLPFLGAELRQVARRPRLPPGSG